VAEVIRNHEISRAAYCTWKPKCGSATAPELSRLRELEQGNARLQRMYAELALENAGIEDVLSRKL
jgi:putative transposase